MSKSCLKIEKIARNCQFRIENEMKTVINAKHELKGHNWVLFAHRLL